MTTAAAGVHAHHVDTHALGYAEPRSSLVVATEHTTFSVGGARGRFVGETLRVAVASGIWAIAASLPFYTLVTSEDRARGLGDATLSAMLRVLGDGSNVGLWLGGAVELPIGNSRERLANGHLELVPSIYGAWALRPRHTILRATVADGIAIDAHTEEHADGHAHGERQGSLTTPHGEHELRYSLGLLQYLVDEAFVELGAHAVTPLAGAARGATLASAQWLVGIAPTRRWIITVGYAHPLFGEHRFERRFTFASQILF